MKAILSTCAFKNISIDEAIEFARIHDFPLEFSSGLVFSPDLEDKFVNAKIKRYLHNYFPPPISPFVLNLASTDSEILTKSINHCINGLKLAESTGSSFFSAHSGFCIDVKPEHLGYKFPKDEPYSREQNLKIFLKSIEKIVAYAESRNLHFCIENNVAASFNQNSNGSNPFLCSDPDEINNVMDNISSDNFHILLDTAHLKVSSLTLNFNVGDAVKKIAPHIFAVHHSDNDGYSDTNSISTTEYWFLPYFNLLKDIHYHVLEVKNIDIMTIKMQMSLLESFIN